ncbi:MAG: hypothetical protein CM1200mP9_04410 [Gammaproteobacteria bacterium]|nr:MAG: hypothetical protein CM1200mP9_04410 [Gammaproteobacteria bacterium]
MTDAYVVGVDMIKFGRFPEKTVPQIGAEAAHLALDDSGLAIQDMEALYCGNLGQARGWWSTHPPGNWPNRHSRGQRVQRMCDRGNGFPRSVGIGQGRPLRFGHSGWRRANG